MLYIAIWYVSIRPVFMRLKEPHNSRTYRDIPNCNVQYKNAPEDGRLKSETC